MIFALMFVTLISSQSSMYTLILPKKVLANSAAVLPELELTEL